MKWRAVLTHISAIVGTVLVWLPILAPIALAGVMLIRVRRFLFDYLMPAELFPVALIGGILLVWASWRARSRRALIGWSLGLTVALLVGGQELAVVTGLASGTIEPNSPWLVVVLATLAAFGLALIAVGIGGILLLHDLTTTQQQ
jgi:hypothetical protein